MISSKKLLIVGSSGFLGHRFMKLASSKFCFGIQGISKGQINLVGKDSLIENKFEYNKENLNEIICQLNPETIINVSGLVGDKLCEAFPEVAVRANTQLPLHLAQITKQIGAKLVHISSDAVFGRKQAERTEEVLARPDTNYGTTKAEGEMLAISNNPSTLVVRTNFVGADLLGNRGLINFFVRSFVKEVEVVGYEDVIFNPISIDYLFRNIQILIEKGATGIIHLGGKTSISKYAFGKLVKGCLNFYSPGLKDCLVRGLSGPGTRTNMTLETRKMSAMGLESGDLRKEVGAMCKVQLESLKF